MVKGKQVYSAGELYTTSAVNQEQLDREIGDSNLISDLITKGKVIIGDTGLKGVAGSSEFSINPGTAYALQSNDIVRRIALESFIEYEPQMSVDKNTVVVDHKIKPGGTVRVYKAFAANRFIEMESVGEGDGTIAQFDLQYVSDGDDADPNFVYINENAIDPSKWFFTTGSNGQSQKAIKFNQTTSEIETDNAQADWNLTGLILKLSLFNPATLSFINVDVNFVGANPLATNDVVAQIQSAINNAGMNPYYQATTSASKISISSINTGFDKRIKIISSGSTAIGVGLLEYSGANLDTEVAGSGEVTLYDRVYCSYTRYYKDYYGSFSLTDYKTITLNDDLTSEEDQNESIPVIVEYEPDLTYYYGGDEYSIAALPSSGNSRYDLVYIEFKEDKKYHEQFFFNTDTLAPERKTSLSRNVYSYEIKVLSAAEAATNPPHVDIDDLLNSSTGVSPYAIPLFEVLVTDAGAVSIENNIIGSVTGTQDVNYLRLSDYRFYNSNLDNFRRREIDVPIKEQWTVTTGNSTQILNFDEEYGYCIADDYVTVADQNPSGDLVYRDAAGAPAAEDIDNLIFAKITTATPGSEEVTFYRGDPNGTLGVDYNVFTTASNEDWILNYYIRSTIERMPVDILKTLSTNGMAIDSGALTETAKNLRKLRVDFNTVMNGKLTYIKSLQEIKWTATRFLFRDIDGSSVNTLTASAANVAIADGEYAYVIFDRTGATVLNDEVKVDSNPWALHPDYENDLIILGVRDGQDFFYANDSNSGTGGGGEWVEEVNAPATMTGSNQLVIPDADDVADSIYSIGRFVRIETVEGLGAENYYYAQISAVASAPPNFTIDIENVQDKDGTSQTITSGATILSFKYVAMQMKYMGINNDVNPQNKALLDHVSDFSIHNSFKYVFNTENLSSQIGVGGSGLSFTMTSDGETDSIVVYHNGVLLDPASEYTVNSTNSFTIIGNVDPDDSVFVSYALLGQEQGFVFNEDLGVQGIGSVFTTAQEFVPSSIMVFRNGGYLTLGSTPNGYTVTDSNEITLGSALTAGETLVVHYDIAGGDTNFVIFNENVSSQAPGSTFSLVNAFFPDSLMVIRNGQVLTQGIDPGDFTVSGTRTFTLNTPAESWESIVVTYNRQWTTVAALIDLTDVNLESPAEGDVLTYNATSEKWENTVQKEYITLKAMVPSVSSYLDIASIPWDGTITGVKIKCDQGTANLTASLYKNGASLVAGPTALLNNNWTDPGPLANTSVVIGDTLNLDVSSYTTGTVLLIEVEITR